MHGTPTQYTVVCAAPGLRRADLHYAVDTASRVLRVSNAAEPENRPVLAYAVNAHMTVYAYPSKGAPVIGERHAGERLQAFAPVQFWVGLCNGGGWVRYDPQVIQVLGRPPLSASEAAAPSGFARWLRLPRDAVLESASADMAPAGGFFVVKFRRLKTEPEEDMVLDTTNGSRWTLRKKDDTPALLARLQASQKRLEGVGAAEGGGD